MFLWTVIIFDQIFDSFLLGTRSGTQIFTKRTKLTSGWFLPTSNRNWCQNKIVRTGGGGTQNYRTSFAVWRDRQFGIGLSNAKQKLNIKETTYKAKHYFCSKKFKKRITTRGIFDPLPGEVVSLSHPPHPGHLSSSWFKATALICFHFLIEKFAFSALLCFSERAEARFYFWHMIVSSRHTTQLELSFEHSV